ncbi:alpha/beta fold hydrolase [Salinibacterium sp.]|uniref:alpha/beta fold hydrolase n=1 Tax=Salinibacterium sp. TaxID=1915057 RepID=UPI00286A3F97|nr:alpha/beta fold hydrolase [Salinibacterium sp.]
MTNRSTLVIVPGLSGRPQWDFPFLVPMLRRQFDVTEVSFEGVAEPDLDSLHALVDTAVASCPTPPVLVGYSLGAVVAAHVGVPVAGLVLIAGWWRPAPKLIAFAEIWASLRAEHSATLDRVAAHALYSAEGWDAARALPADALTDALISLAAHASTKDLSISARTLVIGCFHDEVATTRETQLLFGAIPDARYAEVRSGHAVTHERPAELLELITAFAANPTEFPGGSIIGERLP